MEIKPINKLYALSKIMFKEYFDQLNAQQSMFDHETLFGLDLSKDSERKENIKKEMDVLKKQ